MRPSPGYVHKMKHLLSYALLTAIILSPIHLGAQSLESVLAAHRKASGYEKRKETLTITSIGKLTQMGTTLPISIIQKQPNRYRMDVHLPGARITQGYDGKTGWSFNPFDEQDTLILQGAELEQIRESSDFMGILNTYAVRRYQLEMKGRETTDGRPMVVLHLKKPDRQEMFFYLDSQTWLIYKTEAHLRVEGMEVVAESWFEDYRMVSGMAFPFKIRNRNGHMVTEIQFEAVRINERLDDPLFKVNR